MPRNGDEIQGNKRHFWDDGVEGVDSDILRNEKKQRKQKVRKERDMDVLDLEAQAGMVAKPTVPEIVTAQPPVKVIETEKNTITNKEVVWYDGILDDLKVLVFPSDEWSDMELEKRKEIATKLRNKGMRLPTLSMDKQDIRPYAARQQLQGAVEYLNPLFAGKYRREAVAYLKNMGIGNGEGVEFLPGSAEEKQVEKKVEVVDSVAEESEGKERKDNILNWLTSFSISQDEGEKETYLLALEENGVKIKQFLGGMEKAAPGRAKDVARQLQAVVEIWRMDETKKREYPAMTVIASNYAHVLGLE